ncbi:MAG: hypothetical protein KKH28_10800, partial [Elusimicrobia bacterium]|nr:hypothetical protein [Elusimicrobiota bacterium]
FKKLALASSLLCVFVFPALAGEITPGAVPGSLNYQGRLERDNTPVTGDVHLTFSLYNAAEGGTLRWPTPGCPGSEIKVTATQGIFSASIAPCWDVFSRAEQLYLEVQVRIGVESEVLSPREPLSSAVYAIVAKKIEDGASISVSTLTAACQVLLATASGNVGIGDMSSNPLYPDKKLTVNGGIRILSDGYYFPDGTVQNTAGVAGAGNLTNPSDAVVISDSDNSGAGDIILQIYNTERARVLASNGNLGVGVAAPSERLEVSGNIANTAGNFAIYPRGYLVSRPKTSANAVFRLMPRDNDSPNSSALELYTQVDTSTGTPVNYTRGVIAMTSNGLEFYQEKGGTGQYQPMIFLTGGPSGAGVEAMRISTGGNVSVGGLADPVDNFQAAGDIAANTGVRGARVAIGGYSKSPWANLLNEVRSEDNYHLLLQQTNSYNVGIGTDSPKEKLHVRGSVRSDGVIAATGAFSGAVTVDGNFTANSGLGSWVHLSSTTIYGDLTVIGRVGSDQGFPGYLASTQTFTGLNTFTNPVAALSDILVSNRLGIGAANFSFAPSQYLQIGGGLVANDDASAYLLSGAGTGNSKLYFYRGPTEAARFETQTGNNLALVVGNTKSLVDGDYYRIYNSVFWVSTGTNNTTPAIFVSSWMGNVGMGTAVLDPNWKLTVNGNIRITGSVSNGIIFADGTTLTSADLGGLSAGAISHNEDAVVQSDADLNNTGKVILRAGALDGLVLNTGGNVGIGTQYPVAKLNIRGGDLVLGTPYNPYASDNKEDLIVGGNIVVDGNIEQRSASAAIFNALIVTNDVYLSTAPGGMTGIGTNSPQYKLDAAGDINLSGVLRTGGTQRMSAGGVLSNTTWNGDTITVPYGGTGATSLTGVVHASGTSAFTAGNVVLTSEVSGILPVANGGTGAATLTGVVHASGGSAFTAGNVALTSEVSGILPAANGGTGSDLSAATTGAVPYFSGLGVTSALAAGAADYLLQANGTAAPSWIQSTRSNVGDTIVRRDAGGDFAARNITAVTFGGTASTATHLAGGALGSVPYQSAANTTAMLGAGAANYLLQANGAAAPSWVRSTDANVGNTIVRRDANGDFSASTITANQFNGTTTGGSSYIQATVGTNDYIRARGGDTGYNNGYLEIATADDGTEPIYVRQYQDLSGNPWGTLVRTATLLDASGNTTFPGYVYANYFNMDANVRTDNPEYLAGEWGGDKFLRYVSPANVTVGNADKVDGLYAAAAGVAPSANQVVRTSADTYTYLGWINTVSGNNGTTPITRVYASSDAFLRYYTLANFTTQIKTQAGIIGGTWGINVSGTAANVTGTVAVANGGTGNDTGLAATATALATARTINTVAFDGTANITIYDSSKVPTTRTVNGQALSGNVTVTKSDVGLGSADNTADSVKAVFSATKLTTARTINGVSFDGTGNITVYDTTKAALGTASVGQVVCLKTAADLGYCVAIDTTTGNCTCN